jgi:F-type H+-transporting ATPase subunit gamma
VSARPIEEGEVVTSYLYEPQRSEVLSSLLPKYVEVQIYRAFVESLASEHGARMSAMDSATKNASDMISALSLQYNRARQAVITKELMEIISGAESIR